MEKNKGYTLTNKEAKFLLEIWDDLINELPHQLDEESYSKLFKLFSKMEKQYE